MRSGMFEAIYCCCTGDVPTEVQEDRTTDDEDKKYGCPRKGCCAFAMKCPKCGTRWLLKLEPPDLRD